MATTARKRISPGFKMEVERDAGFCSGEDEEELDTDMHSPTDGSDDSVDVKVKPIASGTSKSKRKCAEPRKFGEDVKRRMLAVDLEGDSSPFRPWSQDVPSGYIPRGYQEEPLSLVLRDQQERLRPTVRPKGPQEISRPGPGPQEVVRLPPNLVKLEEYGTRVQEDSGSSKPQTFSVESLIHDRGGPSSTSSLTASDRRKTALPFQSQQRNYKNMTRERRIEANARERTRVHTISAAFDTLRRAVPAYSHNQKLSKLSVLRIACSYILTLSRVAGNDYSEDSSQPSLSDCVDNVSKTIQMEGKLRKKKDD